VPLEWICNRRPAAWSRRSARRLATAIRSAASRGWGAQRRTRSRTDRTTPTARVPASPSPVKGQPGGYGCPGTGEAARSMLSIPLRGAAGRAVLEQGRWSRRRRRRAGPVGPFCYPVFVVARFLRREPGGPTSITITQGRRVAPSGAREVVTRSLSRAVSFAGTSTKSRSGGENQSGIRCLDCQWSR
jgi:hypothetical protein